MEHVARTIRSRPVHISPHHLPGALNIPDDAFGLIVFAHGSGSSRSSPRNVAVAQALDRAGMATLLFDLLHPGEEAEHHRAKVFDISLLADRLVQAVAWVDRHDDLKPLPLGLFGASTGAAAALVAAAALGPRVGAVVSRGGRPDLAGDALLEVKAPTLLIVGGDDVGVLDLNVQAYERLPYPKMLEIVPGATHLFPEPGAMERVTLLAKSWFEHHLKRGPL
ncbi:MAG TPA: alpha/beta family hydrolase [Rhizomicrobium sp.]|nr:alpha/beta family hydrolase [Rhizomicrobium sp.]